MDIDVENMKDLYYLEVAEVVAEAIEDFKKYLNNI